VAHFHDQVHSSFEILEALIPALPRATHPTTVLDTVPTEIGDERRKKRRYPLSLPLKFKVFTRTKVTLSAGAGNLLNISSKGIAFTTDEFVPPTRLIELSISWPILLHGVTPLKLVAVGRLVRMEGHLIAVEVSRYEFRTAKKQG
jgi:hypothetical protein